MCMVFGIKPDMMLQRNVSLCLDAWLFLGKVIWFHGKGKKKKTLQREYFSTFGCMVILW